MLHREGDGAATAASTAAMTGSTGEVIRTTNDNEEHRRQGVAARWNIVGGQRMEEVKAQWQLNFEEADRRWDELYDEGEHHRLKYALLQSVTSEQMKKNRSSKTK